MKLVIAMMVVVVAARDAGAAAACTGGAGWSPRPSDVLPPRARVVYWRNDPHGKQPGTLVVTLDGQPVAIKQNMVKAAPFELLVIDVDSDKTGTLELGWRVGKDVVTTATYKVQKDAARPSAVRATTDRYHAKIPHSTVQEVFDGLAIHLDAPAVLARVKLRRDASSAWNEFDAPVTDLSGGQMRAGADHAGYAIRIGALGCKTNYEVALLERGVDLEVEVTLLDGSRAKVGGLGRVTLAKRAPTSTNPGDSE